MEKQKRAPLFDIEMKETSGIRITIREVLNPDELVKFERVQKRVWGMPDVLVLPSHAMTAIAHSGGIVLGAYENDELAGIAISFPAFKEGKVYQHHHMCGVLPERQYRGIGYELLLRLREKAMEQGLDLVVWTYEPLEGANANLYIRKLGAICRTYLRNFYGSSLTDELNIGLESDRFLAEWWIDSERVRNRIEKKESIDSSRLLRDGSIVNETAIEKGVGKVKSYDLGLKDMTLLVEIPADFQVVKKVNMDLAREWRKATRAIFENYFEKGYIVTELISSIKGGQRRNFYVLERRLPKDIGEFKF